MDNELEDTLEAIRCEAAFLLIVLQALEVPVKIPKHSAALFLDLDPERLQERFPEDAIPVKDLLDYAVQEDGEEGVTGNAMTLMFQACLEDVPEASDRED